MVGLLLWAVGVGGMGEGVMKGGGEGGDEGGG